jgi:hypothetical protein
MKGNLNLYGNNRGGTTIVSRLPRKVAELYDRDWILADPKPGRALTLATLIEERFPDVRPRPFMLTAQEALRNSGDHDSLIVALDTVGDTRATLANRGASQRASFQLVGRAPGGSGGTRIALAGTIVPGDEDTAEGALALLETLEAMSRNASSRALTGADPLTAVVLRPMRELATRQTLRHLAEKDREPQDLSLGPLNAVLGTSTYPLVPVQSRPLDRYQHRTELALATAGTVPANRWMSRSHQRLLLVAIVVREAPAVHFMTVTESALGKRRVDGVTEFAAPPPPVQTTRTSSSYIEPAMFTD